MYAIYSLDMRIFNHVLIFYLAGQ